jgi:uncharacterized RDD family membrane protein YckC
METVLDSVQIDQTPVRYAGFWIRFVAAIIDGIIVAIAQFAISLILYSKINVDSTAMSEQSMGVNILYFILVLGINVCYYSFMESSNSQATIGKKAVGIKVTDLNGEKISLANAIGRYFSKFVSALILGIGYLMAGFTEKKQALHDMIASTLVVRSN